MPDVEIWKPGSFTKNFSWGPPDNGLLRLYEMIRIGFDNNIESVPRSVFRERVVRSGRLDYENYIALNFFLLNRLIDRVDYVIVDELVFQAMTSSHSTRFDKLALFAFNFSYVGIWAGATRSQRRPALWAYHYVRDRVARNFDWNTSIVDANDIEQFVAGDKRYKAVSARKLATNLNYLYKIGRLEQFNTARVERWWVDALFLALDRLIEDRILNEDAPTENQFLSLIKKSDFAEISGRRSVERELAIGHIVRLYAECGGRERFSLEHVEERRNLKLGEVARYIANDNRPLGALHPTNPRILKSIPRACAMLAVYAGFDVIDSDELEKFDEVEFIRSHTHAALARLSGNGVKPILTAEELMRITREQ
jgi:hypothetical protein